MKKVIFSYRSDKLVGHLFIPKILKKKQRAFLIIHGWTSQQNRGFHLARSLVKGGNIVMTFDLRGHGESDGKIDAVTPKDSLDDVIAAYDFLSRVNGVDKNNILIAGSSYGSYLATLLCAKRNVKALVLRVPSNYQDERFKELHTTTRKIKARQKWKSLLHPYTETKSLRNLHNFTGKVLIVESEKDELVPTQVVQSYGNAVVNKKKLTYVIMKNAPHSISHHPSHQKKFRDTVLNWLK